MIHGILIHNRRGRRPRRPVKPTNKSKFEKSTANIKLILEKSKKLLQNEIKRGIIRKDSMRVGCKTHSQLLIGTFFADIVVKIKELRRYGTESEGSCRGSKGTRSAAYG
jgi:hypothetical protein